MTDELEESEDYYEWWANENAESDEYLAWAGYDTDEWYEYYERTCSEV